MRPFPTNATLGYMLVAVDTGGTKTLVASFTKDGVVRDEFKFPTPHDTHEYVAQLREVLHSRYADESVDAIVIALPGTVKDGIALWCNNLKWANFDVAKALKGTLGNAPILVENDANLAGLGETRFLKKIPTSSLYVTISTGIGTGITTNGTIDPGLRLSEGGRSLVEFDGVVREWETFASGRAIYETYGKYAHDIHNKRTWKQIADRISRGFLAIIPVLQPDIIIIGGSMGTYFAEYSVQLETILTEKLPPHIPCPRFIEAKYPEQAVIYGCYYYALDTLSTLR